MSHKLSDAVFDYLMALAATSSLDGGPPVIGLAGAQGSGKSTLCAMLAKADPHIAVLSLDDFYKTKTERAAMARDLHPLFATRGPPGTHDLELLTDALTTLRAGRTVRLPHFDKIADDRAPNAHWRRHTGPTRAIVLEGWCVGATAQTAAALVAPINSLEREHDPHAAWRSMANATLKSAYSVLWDRIDAFIHLAAPNFEVVALWRLEQEATTLGAHRDALSSDTPARIARFVAHYERITRHMLAGGIRPATWVRLDTARRATSLTAPSPNPPPGGAPTLGV